MRGFIAFDKLLRYHPELRGKVQFWAFLQPSRQDVAVYSRYLRLIRQAVGRTNSEFGSAGWLPIRLEIGESERKAMAALRNFDVLLVNPVYDGLNLVVKEGALVNHTNGVIVLSENAGAHEELHEHVLSVNPFDVEATAAAMHAGLTMSDEERRKLNAGVRDVVRTNDIARWISRQVQDIRDLVASGRWLDRHDHSVVFRLHVFQRDRCFRHRVDSLDRRRGDPGALCALRDQQDANVHHVGLGEAGLDQVTGGGKEMIGVVAREVVGRRQ